MRPASLFFSLFKRGRYYRGSMEADDSAEAKKPRQDRERFIAAALAFCLRHDENFRRSFWERICRVSDDPQTMPPIRDEEILLEHSPWADLCLVSETPNDRFVWLIELKAGAPLAGKQNPLQDEFHAAKNGYGWHFDHHESSRTSRSRLRYIVLGAREKLNLPSRHPTLKNIALRQTEWNDVALCEAAPGVPIEQQSTLVRDLFACFADLQLYPFVMNEAKSVVVSRGLVGIGQATEVLRAVCSWLGAKWRDKNWTAFPNGAGSVIGVYVSRDTDPTGLLGKLQTVSDGETYVAWIGYLVDADDSITRSAWLIFHDPIRRDQTLKQIISRFPGASAAEDDNGEPAIEVKGTAGDGMKDAVWFQSVYAAAGVS